MWPCSSIAGTSRSLKYVKVTWWKKHLYRTRANLRLVYFKPFFEHTGVFFTIMNIKRKGYPILMSLSSKKYRIGMTLIDFLPLQDTTDTTSSAQPQLQSTTSSAGSGNTSNGTYGNFTNRYSCNKITNT